MLWEPIFQFWCSCEPRACEILKSYFKSGFGQFAFRDVDNQFEIFLANCFGLEIYFFQSQNSSLFSCSTQFLDFHSLHSIQILIKWVWWNFSAGDAAGNILFKDKINKWMTIYPIKSVLFDILSCLEHFSKGILLSVKYFPIFPTQMFSDQWSLGSETHDL